MTDEAAPANATLGPVAGGTVLAQDIESAANAYTEYLGYRVTHRGTVSAAMAGAWAAPAQSGAPYLIMTPASGEPHWIRFIEAEPVPGFKPLTTYGWHSLEIVVADVDAIPPTLEGSPFAIVGDPKNLGAGSTIRAMQVRRGNVGEVLYLTQIPDEPEKAHLPLAKSFIDRIFIVVLGSPDMNEARAYYVDNFGLEPGMEAPAMIRVTNEAFGLPAGTEHTICTVKMPGKCLIEIDHYPAQATARPKATGSLPPGIAMISFATPDLGAIDLPLLAPPVAIDDAPYNGRRTAITLGAAGEMIEMIEAAR